MTFELKEILKAAGVSDRELVLLAKNNLTSSKLSDMSHDELVALGVSPMSAGAIVQHFRYMNRPEEEIDQVDIDFANALRSRASGNKGTPPKTDQ